MNQNQPSCLGFLNMIGRMYLMTLGLFTIVALLIFGTIDKSFLLVHGGIFIVLCIILSFIIRVPAPGRKE